MAITIKELRILREGELDWVRRPEPLITERLNLELSWVINQRSYTRAGFFAWFLILSLRKILDTSFFSMTSESPDYQTQTG